MANCITRHIPNTLTCLNLFSGCIACVMAFEARYEWALAFIIFSAVFDFFDGMSARVLKVSSTCTGRTLHYRQGFGFSGR